MQQTSFIDIKYTYNLTRYKIIMNAYIKITYIDDVNKDQ